MGDVVKKVVKVVEDFGGQFDAGHCLVNEQIAARYLANLRAAGLRGRLASLPSSLARASK